MGQRTRTCAVIIHIHFAATHDRFSIRVRESEFRVDMPNAARFNAEGLLAGFGEDEPQAGWTERPIYDPSTSNGSCWELRLCCTRYGSRGT